MSIAPLSLSSSVTVRQPKWVGRDLRIMKVIVECLAKEPIYGSDLKRHDQLLGYLAVELKLNKSTVFQLVDRLSERIRLETNGRYCAGADKCTGIAGYAILNKIVKV